MSGQPAENSNNINSIHLIAFFYKWRKTILSVTLLALFSSVLVALLIPEKFKSTVILFPATSASISKSLMSQNSSPESDLLQFGEEDDMERMLQVLNSEDIRERISNKYKLLEHYRIPKDSKYKKNIVARRI